MINEWINLYGRLTKHGTWPMPTTRRSHIDRRCVDERRKIHDLNYFEDDGPERREFEGAFIDRRSEIEQRTRWVRAGKWLSVYPWRTLYKPGIGWKWWSVCRLENAEAKWMDGWQFRRCDCGMGWHTRQRGEHCGLYPEVGAVGFGGWSCCTDRKVDYGLRLFWSGIIQSMTEKQLIKIIKKLLGTDSDLDFLSKLSKSEIETLVAAVRNRVENFGESWHHLIMTNACIVEFNDFSA